MNRREYVLTAGNLDNIHAQMVAPQSVCPCWLFKVECQQT
jgi:hypothetical protein